MNEKEETKEYYNEIAEQSFNDWFNNPALLPTLTTFIEKLPKNPLVLDIGCGTGGESKRLSNLGAKVIGIDFSEKSIALAKRNVPEAEFLLMDIMHMNFKKEYFDGVMEAGVLFHFPEEEQDKILQKIFIFLKSEGRFLSFYPEGYFEGMQEMNISGKAFKRYSRRLSIEAWINQVINKGFVKYIKHEFNVGAFKCVEFIK
ncbi:MAG: class I SAM-dependent methyltransferase [Spirochaetales bacterium]|nr:class I SAM-dependent methyltransferase [Spirochaetales bacterium]